MHHDTTPRPQDPEHLVQDGLRVVGNSHCALVDDDVEGPGVEREPLRVSLTEPDAICDARARRVLVAVRTISSEMSTPVTSTPNCRA